MMLIEQGNRVKQSVPYDSAKPPVRVTDKGPKASPSPGQNLQAPQRECAGARAGGGVTLRTQVGGRGSGQCGGVRCTRNCGHGNLWPTQESAMWQQCCKLVLNSSGCAQGGQKRRGGIATLSRGGRGAGRGGRAGRRGGPAGRGRGAYKVLAAPEAAQFSGAGARWVGTQRGADRCWGLQVPEPPREQAPAESVCLLLPPASFYPAAVPASASASANSRQVSQAAAWMWGAQRRGPVVPRPGRGGG